MKCKRVNKPGFSTPGNEATVFEKTSLLGGGKAPSYVSLPDTIILDLDSSSAKELCLSGKGWRPGPQDGDGNEDRQVPRTAV